MFTTTPNLLPASSAGSTLRVADGALRRRHVAIVIYNPNDDGSVMNVTRRQVEWLSLNQFELTIVTNHPPLDWSVDNVELVEVTQGVMARCVNYAVDGAARRISSRFTEWETRNWLAQRAFDDAACKRLKSLARSCRIDAAICVQHFCAPGLRALCESAGVPFVVVAHGDIFTHPAKSFAIPLTRYYRSTARIAYRSANHVVTVGTELRDRAIECGALPQRVTVIPNGIDPGELDGETHPAASRRYPFELLYVGRLAPEKGVNVLLTAIDRLRGIAGRLRIVGDGPSTSSLLKQSRGISSDLSIEFTGNVSRAALGEFYRSSDVVVVPSFTEAHGLVALEAAACGVPVIASRVGGLQETVEDGVTGLLVTPGDVVAFGNAIQDLASKPGMRMSMQVNTIQKARSFDWSAQLPRLQSVISNVCAEGANR